MYTARLGVWTISIKNDAVLSYIEGLEPGTRVSVRELSAQLNVSEGTAYKAVKDAERRGLVVIKPKAGTVRVASEQPEIEKAVTARELTRLLGLSVSAGRGALDREVRRVVICDGSETDLLRQLEGIDPKLCLCLCGERPEMQSLVVEQGANLLLTGGAKASWIHINAVERKGQYILSTAHSSYALVRQLDAELAGQGDLVGSTPVADWMQTPDYLYYNDIIADWQRLYLDSSMAKQYPVVSDDLSLYGALDIWKAASAIPSQNIMSILDNRMSLPVVSGRDSLPDVARRLLLNNDSVAAVVDGRQLEGILTANDLLRYYMYAGSSGITRTADSFLSLDSTVSDRNAAVYHVHIPESETGSNGYVEAELLFSGMDSLMQAAGVPRYRLESATCYSSRRTVWSEGLILTCRLSQNAQAWNVFSVEAELSDDTSSYYKAVFLLSAEDMTGGTDHVSNYR